MTQSKVDHRSTCPACGAENIDNTIEPLDAVCECCGLVVEDGSNPTSVEWEITDGAFRRSTEKDWLSECRIRNSTEQQLAEAFNVLEDFAERLSLTNQTREEAVEIYCDAFRVGVTDGRKTECVIATSIRLASRRLGHPVPFTRLTEFSSVEESKVHSCHLTVCDELSIDPDIPGPSEYVAFLHQQLGLTDDARRSVEQLVGGISGEQEFVAKNPAGIAAAGVYVLVDDFTQREVADAVGLTAETVRQRVKQFREVRSDV